MIDDFLSLSFSDQTFFDVTLEVRVQEGRSTAEGHCSTVLALNCTQVTEVSPLDRFLSSSSRARNITAVFCSHFFQLSQRTVLFRDFFTQTDGCFQIFTSFQFGLQRFELSQFVSHQEVDTVQSNTTVVTDNTTTAVCIRQTGDNTRLTAVQDVFSVNIEYTLVVGFTIFSEDFLNLWVQLTAINLARAFNHFDTTECNDCTFQWFFSLQTNDLFQIFVDITSIMRSDG